MLITDLNAMSRQHAFPLEDLSMCCPKGTIASCFQSGRWKTGFKDIKNRFWWFGNHWIPLNIHESLNCRTVLRIWPCGICLCTSWRACLGAGFQSSLAFGPYNMRKNEMEIYRQRYLHRWLCGIEKSVLMLVYMFAYMYIIYCTYVYYIKVIFWMEW